MKVVSVKYSSTSVSNLLDIDLSNGKHYAGSVNAEIFTEQPHSQAILKEIESAVKRIVNKKRD